MTTRRSSQALGARGANEVLAEDVDERRAREARHDRRDGGAERDRRQDVVPPRVVADGRQPAELHREDLHQHHAERERRERDARYRERHAEPVGPAVAPHGGHDADRHAEQHRPRHAPQREPERRHEAVADLGRRPGACVRSDVPKSPVQHAADEAHELLRQRPVEPEVLADELDRFRRRRPGPRRAAPDRPAAGARTGRRASRRAAASAAGRAGAWRCIEHRCSPPERSGIASVTRKAKGRPSFPR